MGTVDFMPKKTPVGVIGTLVESMTFPEGSKTSTWTVSAAVSEKSWKPTADTQGLVHATRVAAGPWVAPMTIEVFFDSRLPRIDTPVDAKRSGSHEPMAMSLGSSPAE